jgi:ABC-2 type transport system ATP-binding protein
MDQELIPEWNERLVAAGIRVYGIQIVNPTLEELFLRVTEGEKIE